MLQSRMPGNARCKRYAWVRKKVQRKEKHFFSIRKQKRMLNRRFRHSYSNMAGHSSMQYKKTAGDAQYEYYS